jgi:aldose 1-epimerase
MHAAVTETSFGKTGDGREIRLYTLTSPSLEVKITSYGARVVSIVTPDYSGKKAGVVAGFDTAAGYLANNPYFGAIAGRYANRIAHGEFRLEGQTYRLAKNDGENSLHGGLQGFDKRLWSGSIHGNSLVLEYLSRDGEEGYPGNLRVQVTYTVSGGDLRIDYEATTDKPTVVNLTNHSYFNLSGFSSDILGHELTVAANTFTPVDKGLIPTGELRQVAGTPFDFRNAHRIGERIGAADEQLRFAGGYDHNWVLTAPNVRQPVLAARVHEPASGRVMEVLTTEPGLQVYTGNFLDGTITGSGGVVYRKRWAMCLETQHFPDSPNHPAFPSTELKPGQKFATTTIYRFSVDRGR